MRVLIMAQCYAPEEVSVSVLITELAAELAHRGHQVNVATCFPNYQWDASSLATGAAFTRLRR
jgi:hypothetical protein